MIRGLEEFSRIRIDDAQLCNARKRVSVRIARASCRAKENINKGLYIIRIEVVSTEIFRKESKPYREDTRALRILGKFYYDD